MTTRNALGLVLDIDSSVLWVGCLITIVYTEVFVTSLTVTDTTHS